MEQEEIIDKLTQHLLHDLAKEEINDFIRSEMIKRYMKRMNISGRELSRQTGIPKSTIEDWLLWNNITEKEYEKKISQGYTKTEIRKALRNNKTNKGMDKNDVYITRFQKMQEQFANTKPEELNQEAKLQAKILIKILIKLTK